jgi:hypothetical protein
MKEIIILGLGMAFFYSSGAYAQVSCSPNVDKKMCVDVAKSLNPIVDHGSPFMAIGIPVELVTQKEYLKRLSDTKELEKRETSFAGGADAAAKSPDKFSLFYAHTLHSRGFITFFRVRPSSHLVSSILIADSEYQVELLGQDGRPNSIVVIETYAEAGDIISGYLCGTIAASMDGSCDMNDLDSYFKEYSK